MDYQMKWNPVEYNNIRTIRVPPDKVWLPDIVLFNKYFFYFYDTKKD